MIMTIVALAVTSACGSSGGHAASSSSAAKKSQPAPTSAAAQAAKADIPGFSGPVDPSGSGQAAHVFGRCLHSWYEKSGSGTRVHIGYPGPADISVDLTINDQSEPPPEAHKQVVMAKGRQSSEVKFGAVPHSGYPQITVASGQRTMVCDAPQH